MSSSPHAPRLRDQLLMLLIGAAWLCVLSVGALTAIWLHHLLLNQAPATLQVLALRTESQLSQLQARQRDRVALLAARSDLRQALQALQQQDSASARHQLGEVLGDAVGTLPSFRHALVLGPNWQILAASDPALLQQAISTDVASTPQQLAIHSDYQIGSDPQGSDSGFRHQVNLIWAGQTLGILQVNESAAELRSVFETSGNTLAPYRLRLFHVDGSQRQLLAGSTLNGEDEIAIERRLQQPGWLLQVAVPRSQVLQPFYQWLGGLIVLAVLLTLAMLLVGGTVARRFGRPLDLLAQYTSQWRVGTPWRARLPSRASAELQQLADSLAQMAQRENAGQKALTEALLETQQVEEQFRRLFENSPVACLLADQRGLIQLINPACASLFGYRIEELHGQSVEMLMPQSARVAHSQRMAGFFNHPRERLLGVSRDLFGLRRDGVELQIEIGITPIRLGGEALALATINDLSTRKAYEQALLAMSRTDGLTGIPNRRHFDQVLAEEWRRLMRNHQGAAILMIDIDHFKRLNDRHGHLTGDETLRMVAKTLKQQIHRPGDFLARYGGEEFVVLLPDTDRDGALLLAEQMRHAVELLPPVASTADSDGAPTTLSISVGVASCQDCTDQPAAELLANADRLLYGAKRAGRNRVMG